MLVTDRSTKDVTSTSTKFSIIRLALFHDCRRELVPQNFNGNAPKWRSRRFDCDLQNMSSSSTAAAMRSNQLAMLKHEREPRQGNANQQQY
jgi:hypothetical protein